jgi:hypothetical protein
MIISEDDIWLGWSQLERRYSLTMAEVRYLRGVVTPIWITRRRLDAEGESAESIEDRHPYTPRRVWALDGLLHEWASLEVHVQTYIRVHGNEGLLWADEPPF